MTLNGITKSALRRTVEWWIARLLGWCNDRDGSCVGRAYRRPGVAWWLCRRHWGGMDAILSWVAGELDEQSSFSESAEERIIRRIRNDERDDVFVKSLTGV